MKLFDPTGRFTLFVFEGEVEEDDVRMFGYVLSPLGPDCDEMGYSSLNELQAVKGRFGLGIERDRHFSPTRMGDLLKVAA